MNCTEIKNKIDELSNLWELTPKRETYLLALKEKYEKICNNDNTENDYDEDDDFYYEEQEVDLDETDEKEWSCKWWFFSFLSDLFGSDDNSDVKVDTDWWNDSSDWWWDSGWWGCDWWDD